MIKHRDRMQLMKKVEKIFLLLLFHGFRGMNSTQQRVMAANGQNRTEQPRDYITDLKHIAARYNRKWEKAINLQSLPWFTSSSKEGPTRSSTASQTISLTVQEHDSRGTFLIHTTALPQAAFLKVLAFYHTTDKKLIHFVSSFNFLPSQTLSHNSRF